jgi:membrane protein implicated in regulation of membrane protease activity
VGDLAEWLADNAWVLWLALALIFGIVETTTLDLMFLMLAGGALAGGVAAMVGLPFLVQALVAIAASAALIGVVRPVAKRHLRQPVNARTGVAALVGRRAIVVERVDAHSGRIKLAGEIWSARSYDNAMIEIGATVDVVEIQGATALVYEVEGP